MKISIRILLLFLVSMILVSVAYMFLIIPRLVEIEWSDNEKKLTQQLEQINDIKNIYMDSIEQDLVFLLSGNDFYSLDIKDTAAIKKVFDKFMEANPEVWTIYICGTDGTFISNATPISADTANNKDKREGAWYRIAMNLPGEIIFSDPYQGESGDSIYMTVSTTIYDNTGEKLIGVLGMDFKIDSLIDYIKIVPTAKIGTIGMIMDKKVIEIDSNKNVSMNNLEGKYLQIKNKVKKNDGKEVTDFLETDHKGYYLLARETTEQPWVIFFMVDENEIHNIVNLRSLPIILTTATIFILILLLLLVFIHFAIVRRIVGLNNCTFHIAKTRDLNITVPERSRDEIGRMGRSFNQMVREIRESQDNLERLVDERTRELKKLTVAVEKNPLSIVITDAKGNFQYVNDKLVELTGYSAEELLEGGLDILLPNSISREEQKELIWENIQRGQTWMVDMQYRKKSGELYWVNRLVTPVFDDNGELTNCISISTDITEQKKSYEELVEAKKQAEIAARAKSDFLANMSHEIRTPMNAIIGLNGLLDNTELNQRQRDYVNKIGRSANNLLGIINDILDFSKLEAGKMNIENIDFCIDDVLENISNIIGMKAFNSSLEFIIDKAPDVPSWLKGDPLRLDQVLINLTNNAVKFTNKGEILLRISVKSQSDKNVRLHFEVRDTGIGMSQEQLNNIFQAFSQADTSITRKFGGTGLGLIISKNIVDKMGGELGVESTYGEGSNFFFTLDFAIGNGKADIKEAVPDSIKDLRIMVVDDNETTLEVINNCLLDFNHPPVLVKSGQDVLDRIKSGEQFDLIILDYMLAGVNGADTWLSVKEILPEDRLPQVIVATAYGRDDVLQELDDSGLSNVLMKPITQAVLLDAITNIYTSHSKRDPFSNLKRMQPDISRIKGASILLVEDNEINQQVARENLESNGFWVDVANNGQEAVEMVEGNPDKYDIVLMDLQMPVMDGYTAARSIREKIAPEDLPIIALSADVMEGIEARVYEAGMQGHLAKPLEPDELMNALNKWVLPGVREINETAEYDNTDENVDAYAGVLQSFNVQEGIERLGSNAEAYHRLLVKFMCNNLNFMEELSSALNSGNIEASQRLIHTMKGVSANIGAAKVNTLSQELENIIINSGGILDEISESIEFAELRIALNEALDEISTLPEIKKDADVCVERISKEEMLQQMKQIIQLLEEYDTEAEDMLRQLESPLLDAGFDAEYKSMSAAVGSYDFDKALAITKNLKDSLEKEN